MSNEEIKETTQKQRTNNRKRRRYTKTDNKNTNINPKNLVVVPCYDGKRLVEPDNLDDLENEKKIEKFKNKTHGYRPPPKTTFFVGNTNSTFIVIPMKRKKLSWLFSNPLTDISTEILFRLFKKNINIVNRYANIRIMYEKWCSEYQKIHDNSRVSYKDLALKRVIKDLIIGTLKNKGGSVAFHAKPSRKELKELNKTTKPEELFYKFLKEKTQYATFLFYDLKYKKYKSYKKELFFAINLEVFTSASTDPTKKWTTRIDLFDNIRVVKQMPSDYFPYNSRVGLIDLSIRNPRVKTITLSKSTQALEIMTCKKEYKNVENNRCYAISLKKMR